MNAIVTIRGADGKPVDVTFTNTFVTVREGTLCVCRKEAGDFIHELAGWAPGQWISWKVS